MFELGPLLPSNIRPEPPSIASMTCTQRPSSAHPMRSRLRSGKPLHSATYHPSVIFEDEHEGEDEDSFTIQEESGSSIDYDSSNGNQSRDLSPTPVLHTTLLDGSSLNPPVNSICTGHQSCMHPQECAPSAATEQSSGAANRPGHTARPASGSSYRVRPSSNSCCRLAPQTERHPTSHSQDKHQQVPDHAPPRPASAAAPEEQAIPDSPACQGGINAVPAAEHTSASTSASTHITSSDSSSLVPNEVAHVQHSPVPPHIIGQCSGSVSMVDEEQVSVMSTGGHAHSIHSSTSSSLQELHTTLNREHGSRRAASGNQAACRPTASSSGHSYSSTHSTFSARSTSATSASKAALYVAEGTHTLHHNLTRASDPGAACGLAPSRDTSNLRFRAARDSGSWSTGSDPVALALTLGTSSSSSSVQASPNAVSEYRHRSHRKRAVSCDGHETGDPGVTGLDRSARAGGGGRLSVLNVELSLGLTSCSYACTKQQQGSGARTATPGCSLPNNVHGASDAVVGPNATQRDLDVVVRQDGLQQVPLAGGRYWEQQCLGRLLTEDEQPGGRGCHRQRGQEGAWGHDGGGQSDGSVPHEPHQQQQLAGIPSPGPTRQHGVAMELGISADGSSPMTPPNIPQGLHEVLLHQDNSRGQQQGDGSLTRGNASCLRSKVRQKQAWVEGGHKAKPSTPWPVKDQLRVALPRPYVTLATHALAKRLYGSCRQPAGSRTQQANIVAALTTARAQGPLFAGRGQGARAGGAAAAAAGNTYGAAKRLYGTCRQLAEARTKGACRPEAVPAAPCEPRGCASGICSSTGQGDDAAAGAGRDGCPLVAVLPGMASRRPSSASWGGGFRTTPSGDRMRRPFSATLKTHERNPGGY